MGDTMFEYLAKAMKGITFTNAMCATGIYNIIYAVPTQTPEYAASGAICILLATLIAYLRERFNL